MIKLEIEINEESSFDLDEGIATETIITINEIGRKATKSERQVLKILKKRLKLNEKIQFENLSKRKTNDEIIQELLNKLL